MEIPDISKQHHYFPESDYTTVELIALEIYQRLRIVSGVASVVFGLVLAHRIGFVDGLFTAAPAWTPG